MTETRQDLTSVYEEAAAWLVRHDGALDEARRGREVGGAAFQAWLAADPLHREAYEDLQGLWLDADELSAGLQIESASRAEGLGGHRRARRRIVAAAMLIAGLALAALWVWRPQAEGTPLQTRTAEQKELPLADGSRVHLNAETLLYVRLGETRREVGLHQGEAIFAVAPDPSRPFVVHTSVGTVEAVGTEFGVSVREGAVEVVVLEGMVRVSPVSSSPFELTAATMANLGADRIATRGVPESEIDRALSWRHGVLEFDDARLDEVLDDLDPYVEGRLVLASEEVGSMRVGGLLRVGSGRDPIGSLVETLPLEAVRLGNAVTILKRREASVE